MTAASGSPNTILRTNPLAYLGRVAQGVWTVIVKEIRGHMRGRRAFLVLTLYLLLLFGFVLIVEQIVAADTGARIGPGAPFASALIGQRIFGALMLLETVLVVFIAAAATAGAISLEREKQTLEMLIATPLPAVAIVVGKLLSALIYVFVLIAASIPLTAVVFVFGGVGPDEVIRGYAVLFASALGFGGIGLFCSAVVRRTQAASMITVFVALALTLGSLISLAFWSAVANDQDRNGVAVGRGPIKGPPPEFLAYLNPLVAQADASDAVLAMVCSPEVALGPWCQAVTTLLSGDRGVIFVEGQANGGVVAESPNLLGAADSDPFWVKSILAWLIVSLALVTVSVRLISPRSRWRPRRPTRPLGRAEST